MDPSFAETLTNVNVGEALPWQQIGLFLLDCSESAVLGFRVQVATVIRISTFSAGFKSAATFKLTMPIMWSTANEQASHNLRMHGLVTRR